MFCSKCGKELKASGNFCEDCGYKTSKVSLSAVKLTQVISVFCRKNALKILLIVGLLAVVVYLGQLAYSHYKTKEYYEYITQTLAKHPHIKNYNAVTSHHVMTPEDLIPNAQLDRGSFVLITAAAFIGHQPEYINAYWDRKMNIFKYAEDRSRKVIPDYGDGFVQGTKDNPGQFLIVGKELIDPRYPNVYALEVSGMSAGTFYIIAIF